MFKKGYGSIARRRVTQTKELLYLEFRADVAERSGSAIQKLSEAAPFWVFKEST